MLVVPPVGEVQRVKRGLHERRWSLDELDDWPEVDKIEVGFELSRAWWGRGLATEGALAALRFGFEEHGLERIISVTAAAHAAARRVVVKAGLQHKGTRYWMNPEVPVVWYAIDRPDWPSSRRGAGEARTRSTPPSGVRGSRTRRSAVSCLRATT